MKLYFSPFSTYARRVRIAALEKGIELEEIEVDMANRAHRQEPYLSLNPYGRVPTLVDGDFVLPESTAILEYLEAKFPEPPLVPADMQQRALLSMHMKLCDIEMASSYVVIFSKRFVPKDKWRTAEMEAAKKPIARHFGILDRQLDGKAFLVADRFSLADICYMPLLHFVDLLDVEVPANVERWRQALLSRPSAQATVPAM